MTSMSIGHLHAQPPSLLRLKTVGLTSHHSDKLYYERRTDGLYKAI